MKRCLLVIILALCCVACDNHSTHWGTLTDVESYIEEHPDSALVVLEEIDVSELSGDEERAKHALLLSMALDKNYIDKTDFEVLQPAIDYYDDNGSATDKMRMYYYQGRIYQNAGNDAAAMGCFVKAISEGNESNDILTKARTYFAQSHIYYSLYEWDNFIETNKSAASLFKESGMLNSFANCYIRIINGYTLKEEPNSALPYIDDCKMMLQDMNISRLTEFYASYLTYLINFGTEQEIKETLYEYTTNVNIPSSKIDWLAIAYAYLEMKNYDDALYALSQCDISNDVAKERKYLSIISDVYQNLGDHKRALESYEKYIILADSIDSAIYTQDTKFVEERHNLEMAKAKETEAKNRLTIIVLGCVVALMASLYIINLIRKRLKKSRVENAQLLSEKALYEQMYNEVVAERDALNEMIANNTIKEEAIEVIKKRLGVLNTIIVSHLSAKDTDIKRANEELEHLIANRNDFIKSTRLTLEENYPHFFAFLKDKGLEEFEIDFCCLYAIGLKGKEIKAYTNLSRHYKDSSEVRQKLGLSESDTNLSNFLQKLLKKEGE